MKRKKSVKVIFDTNVWISFLIGKRLQSIKPLLSSRQIKIIFSEQLAAEIKEATQRPKLIKYFPQNKVSELLELFDLIGNKFKTTPLYHLCRDAKDNFFLDLIDLSKADYLVTGDKDLLELHTFKTAKILTPAAFEIEITKIF
jgi:putative PIN family toxin of toxin-antitoxin system